MKKLLCSSLVLFFLFSGLHVNAQSTKPYTDGPVWTLTFIKSKPGMARAYLQNLSENWIKVMREAKTEGVIMDFKVIGGQPAFSGDWDLMLMVEIKNHAVLDTLDDKMTEIRNKLMGSQEAQDKANMLRVDLRELVGSKTVQELDFK
jgi:hypothetical protein